MSRKKGNVGYLLTLISIVLIIAALLGSFSNLGGVVDKIKDKVSDTDTKDDSSTDKGTASEGTGSSNTNSGDSDVRNVFYYGSSQFKVMTESTSATEGVILFGFESGYDADTKWYCTWSIDEAILENTSCSFIPYDYGSGATLYDIDECYNYNFQSSNNTYEPVVSGPVGDTHFTHLTHQFSGVGKGNTYVLRMFKYTLTDGETVADVLNEICPYIEFITFCTYANVQLKNPNYGNFSGTLLPPETDTPETDSSNGNTGSSSDSESTETYTLYTVKLDGEFPTDGLTVKYQTVENGKKFEYTANVTSTTLIDVVAYTDIYIITPGDNTCAVSSKSGVNNVSYTSTRRVYRVMSNNAYLVFDNVEFAQLTVNNVLKGLEGFTGNYSISYKTLNGGEIVDGSSENVSTESATFTVLVGMAVSVNYYELFSENTTDNVVAAVNGVGCQVIPLDTYAHINVTQSEASFDIYYYES